MPKIKKLKFDDILKEVKGLDKVRTSALLRNNFLFSQYYSHLGRRLNSISRKNLFTLSCYKSRSNVEKNK
jgi:hypothetical protein